jgi:hypothetical protein
MSDQNENDRIAVAGSSLVPCSPWWVFAMDDCEWWLARSLEEAVEDYTKRYDPDPEMIAEAHRLSEADMDRLQYTDENKTQWSFRERLSYLAESGRLSVEMFATTEF